MSTHVTQTHSMPSPLPLSARADPRVVVTGHRCGVVLPLLPPRLSLHHPTTIPTSFPQSVAMGKAYSPEQREHVRQLLEAGRDEDNIEKETQVSDRTIRRWKLELERTGRMANRRRVGRGGIGC